MITGANKPLPLQSSIRNYRISAWNRTLDKSETSKLCTNRRYLLGSRFWRSARFLRVEDDIGGFWVKLPTASPADDLGD
jgi:hypothetical protein